MARPPGFQHLILLVISATAFLIPENALVSSAFYACRQETRESQDQDADDSNPYAVPAHWNLSEITDFLLACEEKPRSIRRRELFVQAVCETAEVVINHQDSTAIQKRIAALQKARTLHFHASWGNESSDQQLASFIPTLDTLSRQLDSKQIRREVVFLQMERELIDFDSDEPEKINTALGRAHDYLVTQELTDRHLRIASNIVRVINRLDSSDSQQKQQLGQRRELLFAKFGKLFQESKEIQLARYGKNLANARADAKSLVGSTVVIEGNTLRGSRYSNSEDRGKIVLVDFWATWCGPCRKALPELKAIYEKFAGEQFSIVGISLDKDPDELREYVDEHQLMWPNIIEADAERLSDAYSVVGIPTFFVLDAEGKVLLVSNRISDVAPAVERAVQDLKNATQ